MAFYFNVIPKENFFRKKRKLLLKKSQTNESMQPFNQETPDKKAKDLTFE